MIDTRQTSTFRSRGVLTILAVTLVAIAHPARAAEPAPATQRPDKMRVEVERSDGERGTVVFDGRWLTAFNARENVYARVEHAGGLDRALVYMVRDLQATMPLARMFT